MGSFEEVGEVGAGGKADRIPRVFGQYRLRRLIGKGGMARVFEGEHTGLRKRVAVKVLDPHMARNDVLRARFLREGERAARVRHANIVDITDVGEILGLPFLVMEFLEGETLAELLERQGALRLGQAVNVVLPVIAAVAAGHEMGVVHRDLKPENVFLHRDGALRVRPKVLDFGVSRAIGHEARDRLTVPNSVLGTPYYMAPEQARGEECDERADQYALASMFFEMVTGVCARDADTLVALLELAATGAMTRISEHVPDIDRDIDDAVARAMAPLPEHRFQSVVDLAFALLPHASARARDYWTAELGGRIGEERSYDHLPSLDEETTHALSAPARLPPVGGQASPAIDFEDVVPGDGALDLLAAMPAPRVPTEVRAMPERRLVPTPLALLADASTPPPPSSAPWRRLAPYVLTAVVSAGLAVLAVEVGRRDEPPLRQPPPAAAVPVSEPAHDRESVAMSIRVRPSDARVYLDGALLAQGSYDGRVQRDGKRYEVRVEASGFVPAMRAVVAEEDVRLRVELEPKAARAVSPDATPPPAPRIVRIAAEPDADSEPEPPAPDPSEAPPAPERPDLERANPYR